jgi:hypothetical protein
MPPLFQPTSPRALRSVTLPSYGAKMSSLPPLHLLATVCPISFPLEPKLKHCICTTAVGHPPQTIRLPPSTAIKCHLNIDHSPYHSITSSFYFLSSQSTTSSELHLPSLFHFTTVPCLASLHTMTPTMTK